MPETYGKRQRRNLRHQPALDFTGNLEIALHSHAIGKLESQQKQQRQDGQRPADDPEKGKDNEGERKQKKNAPGRGKLQDHRPEKKSSEF